LKRVPSVKHGSNQRATPFEFVLEELARLEVHTRPMFGCTAVYVGEKIVLVLRKKEKTDADTGIWVCIPDDQVAGMKREFPMLRGVSFFEDPDSAWQVLPESQPEFEEIALKLCAMIRKRDPRIGRVPKARKARKSSRKLDI
jgi:hypothetical protein